MRLSDFDFHLPEENIALRPAEPRDAARLLVVQPDNPVQLIDSRVRDLPGYMRAGDVMIFNDTRVIPARLHGIRLRDGVAAKIEIMLHKREDAARWTVFARPAKKLREGDKLSFPGESGASLSAVVLAKISDGNIVIGFDVAGAVLDAAIALCGALPLPPYIAQKRPADPRDATDYQTVYARESGAVAAPTAGLHFTPELLARIDSLGVARRFVTLHVGAGTFLPVKTDDIRQHRMHAEWGVVPADLAEAVNAAKARGGRVIAVGTTSLRLLESAADEDGRLAAFSGETAIFITPGYRFRIVDLLMTNFHLPKSTLMMLVSAFAGMETMRQAYAHAIAKGYRFYSYGDSSLLMRQS
ncbi:MAG: tRNA preQ1(34) S-adenosylmethionine ribosyltransferase-isomerase QueA [Methylocystis sp.]|nr:tRNA preQ1(34) S-adenosylmethionine ribosyltransferase-isomerase QueA [Methylocystis sp.]MCA3587685.1 tRNA preQ1(34) S-adenosylmethionine ribosyltransferase-isomerase QueA [Methylocystis sp.]MCA3590811.1 tRNA preQ1(34) S-adenosylmethionine ribosyltransferase-isomerase QueA [Methylocystis sp.]